MALIVWLLRSSATVQHENGSGEPETERKLRNSLHVSFRFQERGAADEGASSEELANASSFAFAFPSIHS